jgi:hypothetical protein
MKSKIVEESIKETDNKRVKRSSHPQSSMIKGTEINQVYEELGGEVNEDLYHYLDWLGLAKVPDLLVLTSSHHYYFEVEDLKNIRTVVNLKNLNNISRPKEFIHEIYSILPDKCHFIGRFIDNRKQNIFIPVKKSPNPHDGEHLNGESETGRWHLFLNVLYGVIDAKTNKYLTEKSVRSVLEETGLKILDITEFNGLTYFCTQKDNPSSE